MSEKGCEWSGCFSELSTHKTACPYIALQTFIHQHDNQIEILNNQVHSLQAENQNLKLAIGTLEEQIQMIMERLDPLLQLTTNSPFSPMEANLSLVDTSNILLSEHDQIKSDIEMLSANLASLESKQNLALMTEHLKIQEDLQHLRNVHSKTREEVQSLRNLYSLLLMERKVKGSSRIASTSGVSKPQRSSESHQSGGHKQETKL
ncbi:hypothetical protein BKA69DRAFT_1036691 [Paraphysoderma sedebokerense]|nr:hypothetical protein BKA69DRAFT_1036677 [Paraphysoderma sedebokerense]KAI9143578.1 hypothetical protein BKA69DRAFT_1036691 [Paraphysoderma sedebokerense]